ncbi:hypothetical protein Pelo_19919 [Pelomyxa schiedti]|nr:hypothetical protein Pelo_19919 [Pelomyxa schiedti]
MMFSTPTFWSGTFCAIEIVTPMYIPMQPLQLHMFLLASWDFPEEDGACAVAEPLLFVGLVSLIFATVDDDDDDDDDELDVEEL